MKDTFSIKHLPTTASSIGKIPIISGWRYHFSLLWDFSFCRNFIFKLFTKERRSSLEFSGILSLLSMICFSCLSLLERLYISYDHLLLVWFFSMFFLYPFGFGWSNAVCNFQSMKSPVELNSLFSTFFRYITWFVILPY